MLKLNMTKVELPAAASILARDPHVRCLLLAHLLHREWLATPGLLQGFPALSLAQTRGTTEPAIIPTPVRAKLSIPESMWHDDWPLHQDEEA
jgi:hypothetical protein